MSIKQLFLMCLVGMYILGIISGFGIGMVMQKYHDDYQINSASQPKHILQTSEGLYVIQKYNESCMTVECVANTTIIKRD